MAKRKRSDSVSAEIEALGKAASKIRPPLYVSVAEEELPFWDAVISMRGEWLPNDLILAAELARIYNDIEHYSRIVRDGKRVQITTTENTIRQDVSAAHKVLKDLQADALRYCRTLQIHPRATQGESRDQVKRNELARNAKKKLDDAGSLIATPRSIN